MNTKVLQLAGCILLDKQGRILLLRRNTASRQQWEIPGGKIERGESAKQAAIREIKEELGVEVEIVKMLGSKGFTEDDNTMYYTWFEAKIIGGKLTILEPLTFDQLRYFSVTDLKASIKKLSPNTQNYLIFANIVRLL